IEGSSVELAMSMTRQSPHICRRLSAPPIANIEWPPSFPVMFSIMRRVPNGLPQRTQLKGSASFSVTGCFAVSLNDNLGTSEMAFSGQVFSQSPHCTQLRSMKRSNGASAESSSALSGQAPMQALQSVQVSLLTVIAPNGAPAGRSIFSFLVFDRKSKAKSRDVRFSADRLKVAAFFTVSAGARFQSEFSVPSTTTKCTPA